MDLFFQDKRIHTRGESTLYWVISVKNMLRLPRKAEIETWLTIQVSG